MNKGELWLYKCILVIIEMEKTAREKNFERLFERINKDWSSFFIYLQYSSCFQHISKVTQSSVEATVMFTVIS